MIAKNFAISNQKSIRLSINFAYDKNINNKGIGEILNKKNIKIKRNKKC